MIASTRLYGGFLQSLANKEINLSADTLKVMLCTSEYIPDQDTHRYRSDVTNEVAGDGYTTGGVILSSVVVDYGPGANTLRLTAANPTWESSTIKARYAIVYDSTPATAATKPLICCGDFGTDISSTNAIFEIVWDSAEGIVAITAA